MVVIADEAHHRDVHHFASDIHYQGRDHFGYKKLIKLLELSNLKKTLQVEVKQLRSVKYAFSWLDHFQTMKEVDLKGDEKIDMINCLNCSEIWENFQYKLDTKSMENALRACCKGIKIGKILIHREGDNGQQIY
ncbi:uridine/cytidine kinase [Trifolium repens]|nr:uridine/cytidine kinase [Trifolium repens]